MKIPHLFQQNSGTKLFAFVCVWSIAVLVGMSSIVWYSNIPGENGTPPNIVLSEAPISIKDNQYQLLMFIHPKCPCTRSSIRELSRHMSHYPKNISCTFFCFTPADKKDDWSQTDIVESTQIIPNSTTIIDVDGKWTKAFDAKTSGHILLYHPNGSLLFSGGITAGRGHEGDNLGRTFLTKVVTNKSRTINQCPVFGCPIAK